MGASRAYRHRYALAMPLCHYAHLAIPLYPRSSRFAPLNPTNELQLVWALVTFPFWLGRLPSDPLPTGLLVCLL